VSEDKGSAEVGLDAGVWVSLVGEPLDLEGVAELFSRSTAVRIRREGDLYFITEPGLARLATDPAKRDRAIEVIELVNGAAHLEWANHLPLTAGSKVITIAQNGSRREGTVVGVGTARVRVRAQQVQVLRDSVPVVPPPPVPPRWVEAALTDGNVGAALRMLADPDVAWGRLYNVYEIVKEDVGGRGMDHWSTSEERERFARTANSRQALGDDARHGHTKHEPPPNPMSLGEARRLVRSIVAGWLSQRSS
jgi:hypothetical protein